MNKRQAAALAKAKSSIDAARLLLESGYPGFAASRAYYAMFYAAEAALEELGSDSRRTPRSFRHSAVSLPKLASSIGSFIAF